jgi:hypothetical protein
VGDIHSCEKLETTGLKYTHLLILWKINFIFKNNKNKSIQFQCTISLAN